MFRESKEQFRFQAREGFTVVEQGQQIRIERTAQEPLVLTMPKIRELDPMQALPLRRRRGGRLAVLLPRAGAPSISPTRPRPRRSVRSGALADAESAAQAAQVRALRYQVNPHFLFNTLNSLSSLVMTGRTDRAETMLLALSTFFRTSLSLDPSADVSSPRKSTSSGSISTSRRRAFPTGSMSRSTCPRA